MELSYHNPAITVSGGGVDRDRLNEADIVLVSEGVGGEEKRLEKKYTRKNKYTCKCEMTTRKMKRTSRYLLLFGYQLSL